VIYFATKPKGRYGKMMQLGKKGVSKFKQGKGKPFLNISWKYDLKM